MDSTTAEVVSEINDIQSHMLNLAVSILINYNISFDHFTQRYEYMHSEHVNYIKQCHQRQQEYQEQHKQEFQQDNLVEEQNQQSEAKDETLQSNTSSMSSVGSWLDIQQESENKKCQSDEGPLYVSTRRDFCCALQNGIRICPRYSNCLNSDCKNFHIKEQFICPHVTKGSYCDVEGCNLIVIRACRKGKKCNDKNCSFRH